MSEEQETYISYINTNELAKRLSMSVQSIRTWCINGKIPHHKFGAAVRYNYQEVLDALEKQEKIEVEVEIEVNIEEEE